MRKITFLSLLILALFSFSSFAQTGGDLYVENNTDQTLSNINFTSSVTMVSFANITPGNSQSGMITYNYPDNITITLFFSTVPAGAVARVYNSDFSNPDGTFNIQPGLNIFQLNGPIASGGILVHVDPK